MIQAAPDSRPTGRHDHDGHVKLAVARPALITGNFEYIQSVEGVIAELDLRHRPAAGIGNPQGRSQDAAFIQGRVPGRFQALRGREDASEGRTDVLSEDIGDAQVLLGIVQSHSNRLNQCRHKPPELK